MEIALLLWVVCGIAGAMVASSRNASGCLWFGLGVLLGPIGLALSFTAGSGRKCPNCQSSVHEAATKCPKCQSALGGAAVDTGDQATRALVARLEYDRAGNAEKKYRCPKCKARIEKEASHCAGCGQVFRSHTKKCPDCAETIQREARKCRFCGFRFEPELPGSAEGVLPLDPRNEEEAGGK